MIKLLKRLFKTEGDPGYLKSEKSGDLSHTDNTTTITPTTPKTTIQELEKLTFEPREKGRILNFEEEFWDDIISHAILSPNIKDKLMCEDDVWISVDGMTKRNADTKTITYDWVIKLTARVPDRDMPYVYSPIGDSLKPKKYVISSFRYWEIVSVGSESIHVGDTYIAPGIYLPNYVGGSAPYKLKMDKEELKRGFLNALNPIGRALWNW